MKDELLTIARDLREAIQHDLRAAAMDWAARRLEALAQSPHHKEEDSMSMVPNAPRVGDWMQTATGKKFWPYDPRPEDVHLLDIAAHLSKICRFNGACTYHYSVAQHCVYASHQVPPEHQFTALMHDAPEAYTGDLHRPFKRGLFGVSKIEERIWFAVATRFGLPLQLPTCVKEADEAMLKAENAQLMVPGEAWTYRYDVPPANVKISPWTPEQAREAFISRFEGLRLADSARRSPCAAPTRAWDV